jgi:regulator of sigma E protease
MTYCQPFTPAAVGQIQPGSSAEQGGIRPGDLILKIDGATVHGLRIFSKRCASIRASRSPSSCAGAAREKTLHVTPRRTKLTDRFGNHYEIGLLGIARPASVRTSPDPR